MKHSYTLKSPVLDRPQEVRAAHPRIAAHEFFGAEPLYLGTHYAIQSRNKEGKDKNGKPTRRKYTVRLQVVRYGHPDHPRSLEVWESKP